MNKPPVLVPDASIALAYLLNESQYFEAITKLFDRAAQGQCQLLAPTLLMHEICNRLSRIPNFPDEIIEQSLDIYAMIEPTPPVLQKTFSLIRRYRKIVWYDAVYHATAIIFNGTLITADERYYKIAHSEGNILFIGNYK